VGLTEHEIRNTSYGNSVITLTRSLRLSKRTDYTCYLGWCYYWKCRDPDDHLFRHWVMF